MVVVSVALALGMSAAANAAKQKEEDSVYKWGRWAVLSPAAGGQPYVAALTPDAVNNSRPGEADEFQPKVEQSSRVGIVPINPDIPIEITPPSPPPPPAPNLGGET